MCFLNKLFIQRKKVRHSPQGRIQKMAIGVVIPKKFINNEINFHKQQMFRESWIGWC